MGVGALVKMPKSAAATFPPDTQIVDSYEGSDETDGDETVVSEAGVSVREISGKSDGKSDGGDGGGVGSSNGGGDDNSDTPATYDPPWVARFLYAYLTCIALPIIVRHNFNLRCQLLAALIRYGLRLFSCTIPSCRHPTARRRLAHSLTHYFTHAHIATCVLLSTSAWRRDWSGMVSLMACVMLRQVCPAPRLGPTSLIPGWMQLLYQAIFMLVDIAHTPAHPSVEQLLTLGSRLLYAVCELLTLELLLWAERTRFWR